MKCLSDFQKSPPARGFFLKRRDKKTEDRREILNKIIANLKFQIKPALKISSRREATLNLRKSPPEFLASLSFKSLLRERLFLRQGVHRAECGLKSACPPPLDLRPSDLTKAFLTESKKTTTRFRQTAGGPRRFLQARKGFLRIGRIGGRQNGQVTVELILMLVLVAVLMKVSWNVIKEGKYLEAFVTAPNKGLSSMMSNGNWITNPEESKRYHPNRYGKRYSIEN